MSGLRLDLGMERPNGQKEGFLKRIGTRPMPMKSHLLQERKSKGWQ